MVTILPLENLREVNHVLILYPSAKNAVQLVLPETPHLRSLELRIERTLQRNCILFTCWEKLAIHNGHQAIPSTIERTGQYFTPDSLLPIPCSQQLPT